MNLDHLITKFDRLLKLAFPVWPISSVNISPAENIKENILSDVEKHQSQSMMRVNLAGEVAAQGLYRGQLLLARDELLKKDLERAAQEEFDHYVWCAERLKEFDARPSVFNPIWYAGAFTIGLVAAILSDKISLGFIIATEEQVGRHLASHLYKLPKTDKKSRAIVAQMYEDEISHAEHAEHEGGVRLPVLIQEIMHWMAQVMIKSSSII
jgi:ubiquinone biosynthesis monooxygenase Coq7